MRSTIRGTNANIRHRPNRIRGHSPSITTRHCGSGDDAAADRFTTVRPALEEVLRAACRSSQIATEVFTGEVIYAIRAAAHCGATVRELALASRTSEEHVRRILGGV